MNFTASLYMDMFNVHNALANLWVVRSTASMTYSSWNLLVTSSSKYTWREEEGGEGDGGKGGGKKKMAERGNKEKAELISH